MKMKRNCFIMFMVFVVSAFFLANAGPARANDYAKELEMLKQRIEELEKKIKEGEKERAELKEATIEKKKEDEELEKIKETFKRLSFGVGITGIMQGTLNNDDNGTNGDDVIDGDYSIDLEITADLDKWGTGYLHFEAGDGEGITDEVNALTGVNADALGDQNDVEVSEAWWEFNPFGYEPVTFTLGKLDPTVYFDANAVANDECTQFLADIFVNNIAIEWPDYTPGFRLEYKPIDLVDINLGLLSADNDWDDLFEDVFAIAEVNFMPKFGDLQGNYRFYGWINGSDHVKWSDVLKRNREENNKKNYGFGLSFDQEVTRDITLFCRFGFQDDDVAGSRFSSGDIEDTIAMEYSWSVGGQIKGAPWGRPDDIFAIAIGQAVLSDHFEKWQRQHGIDPEDETHLEAYYSIFLNEHVAVSPDFQLINAMGGDDNADPIYIFGARCQIDF